jgi:multidrug efflux pump subunit AcrB
VVVLAIFGSFGGCVGIMMSGKVGGAFLPPNDEAQFEIYLQTPEGTTLEATTLIAERLARKTRQIGEVDSTLVTVADGDQRQANVGKVYVHLINPELRVRAQEDVMEEVRKTVLPDVPVGTRVAAQQVNDFSLGGQNAMVSYVISGPDLDKLERYATKALAEIKLVPGVVDLDSSLLDPIGETTVHPDLDRAAMLGVDPNDVTATLAVLIGGMEASTFEEGGDQYPVFLRAAARFRNDPSALSLISVPSRTLGQVPLSDVIKIGAGKGKSKITRMSRERAITITCNVSPGVSQSDVVAGVVKTLKGLDMPPGYAYDAFGQSKEMAKMFPAFIFAVLMAFVFMYLVLAAQFESWVYPFIIMLALPLTFPFAILSLLLTGGSLNIFSMLGLIVLFGMVKKNAILQVDHTNHLRRQGLPRTEALLAANRDRLRPILMTTFAFVAGMMPLVLSKGIGAGMSKAMASIVVGGQVLSLALTLLAVPVLYTFFDSLAVKVTGGVGRLIRGGKPAPDRGQSEVGVAELH